MTNNERIDLLRSYRADRGLSQREMAAQMGVQFLGRIPVDPGLAAACDNGMPYVNEHAESLTTKAFAAVINRAIRKPMNNTD